MTAASATEAKPIPEKKELLEFSSGESYYDPSTIATRVHKKLREMAEKDPDSGRAEWITGVAESLEEHINAFDPNHESNGLSREAFEKLKGEDPEKWAVLYNAFSQGITDYMVTAEKLIQDAAGNAGAEYLAVKFIEIAAGGEVSNEVIHANLQEYGISELDRDSKPIIKLLRQVQRSRIVPFDQHVRKNDYQDRVELVENRMQAAAQTRRAALGNIVEVIHRITPQDEEESVFKPINRLETRTKVETIVNNDEGVDALTVEQIKSRLQAQWEVETKGKKYLDTRGGDNLVDKNIFGEYKHETVQYNTTRTQVVRVEDPKTNKVRLVKVDVPVVTFNMDAQLSEVTRTPVGQARWKDPVIHIPVFDAEFNDVDKIGFMLETTTIPPAVELPDGAIKIPVMKKDEARWLVVGKGQYNQFRMNLEKGLNSFRKAGFDYDPEEVLKKQLKGTHKEVTHEEYRGAAYGTYEQSPETWLDYKQAEQVTKRNMKKAVDYLPDTDTRKEEIQIQILSVEKLYTQVTTDVGRIDAYKLEAKKRLAMKGVTSDQDGYDKFLDTEYALIVQEYAELSLALKSAYERIRNEIAALDPNIECEDREQVIEALMEYLSTLDTQILRQVPAREISLGVAKVDNLTEKELEALRKRTKNALLLEKLGEAIENGTDVPEDHKPEIIRRVPAYEVDKARFLSGEPETINVIKKILRGEAPSWGENLRGGFVRVEPGGIENVGANLKISKSILITLSEKTQGDVTEDLSIHRYEGAEYMLDPSEALMVVTRRSLNEEGEQVLEQSFVELPKTMADLLELQDREAKDYGINDYAARVLNKGLQNAIDNVEEPEPNPEDGYSNYSKTLGVTLESGPSGYTPKNRDKTGTVAADTITSISGS